MQRIPLKQTLFFDNDKIPEWMILDRLAPIVLERTEGCVVDIGIGQTTEILARHAKSLSRQQFSIDTDHGKCEWARTEDFWHEKLEVYHGKSLAFIESFEQRGLVPAVVMLDGCHKAKVLQPEVEFFVERLAANGMMFLHDTCPMEGYYERKLSWGKEMDTYKPRKWLENRAKEKRDIDILTWRYGVGFTMVLKKASDLPFYRN